MSRRIKAVLFDLDGVVVDTLHYHYMAWKKVFSDIGGKITEHTVLLHEGRSSREILPILLEEAGLIMPVDAHDEFIEKKRSHYREIVDVQFFHGALSVINWLRGHGLVTAVVTACAEKTMQKSLSENERALFDLIQTGDDVPRAKPFPDPYDLARRKLNLEPDACLVVENAPLGIESAKAAGLYCVAVETTLGREYLKMADVIIPDIQKLLDLQILK